MRVEMVDEVNRKRPAPSEPTDGLDQAKRQRVATNAPSAVTPDTMPTAPPLPPGPVSWRQLFTLNPEGSTVNFDVQAFRDPEQLVRILVPVLQSVDQVRLGHALNVRCHNSPCLARTVVKTACNNNDLSSSFIRTRRTNQCCSSHQHARRTSQNIG